MQLREIYASPNEFEAERYLYRTYSMVKHSNPVGEYLAFPLAATRHTLVLDTNIPNNPLVRAHLFGLGVHLTRTVEAASRIGASEGLDVGDFAKRLAEQFKNLSRLMEQYIISLIQQKANS